MAPASLSSLPPSGRPRPMGPSLLARAALLPALLWSLNAPAQPLPELWRAALERDPAVAGAAAQAQAAAERVVQAKAAYAPTVAFTGSYNDTRLREGADDALRPFWDRKHGVQLSQPLLRPTLAPARLGAQAQAAQAQALLAQARLESGQRLAEALFELFKSRDTLALTQAQRAATAEHLAAARRRYHVGNAPVTDLREAEARADVVAAQVAVAEQELQLRQQLLAELTGLPAAPLLERGLDGEQLPALQAAALAQWLQDALDASPQLQQAQRALEAAGADVDRARAGHQPTLDLVASQTRSSDSGTVLTPLGRRYEASQVGVNLNVPLFAGGATQSRVREALAQQDRARSEVDAARRALSIAVHEQFSAALSALMQARGLATAVSSGELALRANRRGYESGTRVMAEVLDAQSKLFETQRDLTRARYDAWLSLLRLRALAGRLGEEDFRALEALLVAVPRELPVRAPNRERGRP